jgi:hypothetical protein
MKRTQQLAVALAGLVLAGTVRPACASVTVTGFTGDFAPGDWTESGSPGAAAAFGQFSLDITAPASASPFAFSISITPSASTDYTLGFDWQMINNGGTGNPTAYYAVTAPGDPTPIEGGTDDPLTGDGNSGVINSIDIPAGDTLSIDFVGGGTSAGKTPAQFDMVGTVPEAGTLWAGVFVLAVVTLSTLRPKRCGSARKRS